jgi:hypothetical protein
MSNESVNNENKGYSSDPEIQERKLTDEINRKVRNDNARRMSRVLLERARQAAQEQESKEE